MPDERKTEPVATELDRAGPPEPESREERGPFIPNRPRRFRLESFAVRLIATAGVVGIGTAVGAIMGTQDVDAWIIALVVSTVSVLLAAILWSSRSL
jgi:hypothetical protein